MEDHRPGSLQSSLGRLHPGCESALGAQMPTWRRVGCFRRVVFMLSVDGYNSGVGELEMQIASGVDAGITWQLYQVQQSPKEVYC